MNFVFILSKKHREYKFLGQLILKLETDQTLNWPSFLDSYALISGQMNSLLRTMKHEKTPALKKYITLPLLLSPDRDEELLKITEHRVQTFSHDLIPDYLRTRPDPELEARHQVRHELDIYVMTHDTMNF